MTDKELIMLFDRRDETAITELDRKYGSRCRAVALGVLKNEADAEECVNDAFLKVWNKAIDRYRTDRRDKRIPPEDVAPLEDAAELADNAGDDGFSRETVGLIEEYLNGIDRKKRLIFIGRYYRERSVSELASELGIAEGTVLSSIHRTKKGLIEFLKKRGVSI